jgi:hypothetical protein
VGVCVCVYAQILRLEIHAEFAFDVVFPLRRANVSEQFVFLSAICMVACAPSGIEFSLTRVYCVRFFLGVASKHRSDLNRSSSLWTFETHYYPGIYCTETRYMPPVISLVPPREMRSGKVALSLSPKHLSLRQKFNGEEGMHSYLFIDCKLSIKSFSKRNDG